MAFELYFLGSAGCICKAVNDIEARLKDNRGCRPIALVLEAVSHEAMSVVSEYLKVRGVYIRYFKLPKSNLWQLLVMSAAMIYARVTLSRVHSYHNCNWPSLDLSIWAIRPRVYITRDLMHGTKSLERFTNKKLDHTSLLNFGFGIFLEKAGLFALASMNDRLGNVHYDIVCTKYPSNVTVSGSLKNVNSELRKFTRAAFGISSRIGVLLLSDDVLIDLGCQISLVKVCGSLLAEFGIRLYTKPHPQIYEKTLGLLKGEIDPNNILPNIPVEFLIDDELILMGFDSSALSSRAVSLMKLAATSQRIVDEYVEMTTEPPYMPSSIEELRQHIITSRQD